MTGGATGRVLIDGAAAAGSSVAVQLRRGGYQDEIVLVGDEGIAPDDRSSIRANPMASLSWGVKASFVDYVAGIRDGAIEFDEGVELDGDKFVYPFQTIVDDGDRVEIRFAGRTAMAGHGGLLWLMIAQPSLEIGSTGATLSVLDTRDRSRRVPLADLHALEAEATGRLVGDATLRAECTWMFAERYPAGMTLDPVHVTLPTEALHLVNRCRRASRTRSRGGQVE